VSSVSAVSPQTPPFGAAFGTGTKDDEGMSQGERIRGRRVVVAGATSESGAAVCAALVAAGASVVALGSNAGRLATLAGRVPGIATEVCDLADSGAVAALAYRLSVVADAPTPSGGSNTTAGRDLADATSASDSGTSSAGGTGIDGLIHLVGGWVGGTGIVGQTDEGWAAMERSFRTLRTTTRAFYPALLGSEAGRVAFVSSVSVDAPTASGADYTAAKAASESWMRSVADGFRADQAGDTTGLRAAATIFAVKALVDDRMRAASPEKTFPGFTDVATLASAVVALWNAPASDLNGTRIRL